MKKTKRQERNIQDSELMIICKKFFDEELDKPIDLAYERNDTGSGQLFADCFKDYFRFCSETNSWWVFDGQRWREDRRELDTAAAAKVLSQIWLIKALEIPDRRIQENYYKYVSKFGYIRQRRNMIEDARTVHYIHADIFDSDPNLFNCMNGTLNLATGEFSSHYSGDYLTKISNVVYDPTAKSPDFEKFLMEMTQNDSEKAEYIQKLTGYFLTGSVEEEEGYILFGYTTRNGKGTLVECISGILGDYAVNVLPETLQEKSKDSSRTSSDVLRLKGARLAFINEPSKNFKLDVANFKNLTGGDRITARGLYQAEQEFDPQFKLLMITNHLPYVNDDTLFSSDRINVIECNRHFSAKERDKGLKKRLKEPENLSGILNWAIEGLKLYQQEGIEPPECVRNATAEYRRKSDKVQCFIEEELEKGSGNILAADVYDRYRIWAERTGVYPEGKQNFFADLTTKGMLAKTGTVRGRTVHNVIRGWDFKFKSVPPGQNVFRKEKS